MYRFGAQQILGNVDYTDLTEDLSNDHVAASEYCVRNLKLIMPNIEEWQKDSGEKYANLIKVYEEVINQYLRVLSHVIDEIGGVSYKEVMQGEPSENKSVEYGTKENQKRAMLWAVEQARTCTDWLMPDYLMTRFPANIEPNKYDVMPASITSKLFNKNALARMYVASEKLGYEDAYELDEYVDDLLDEIFASSIKGRNLSPAEMEMESVALERLVALSGVTTNSFKGRAFADEAEDFFTNRVNAANRSSLICNHTYSGCNHDSVSEVSSENFENSFFRVNSKQAVAPMSIIKPLCYEKVKWVRNLYKKKRRCANNETEYFYNMQLVKIEQILSSNATFSNK